MNISYTFGIIDLMHYGHVKTLRQAKNDSDLHFFGLVGDDAAVSWMGALVSNYEERKSVVESLICIDKVLFQKTLDPLENLKALHDEYPDAKIKLYHGNNWKIMPSEEYLKSIGGEVVFTEYYEKLKPENILKLLNQRKTSARPASDLISTKANTLLALKQRLKLSKVEDIMVLKVKDYEENPDSSCKKVQEAFSGEKIVVRSSSSNEDSFESSNAGHYDSVLDVNSNSQSEVSSAIERVIASYKKDISGGCIEEQILIQSQTKDVVASGVVFTRDINHNRPYYLINYDDSGSTDSVTSGKGGRSIWISRDNSSEAVEGSLWKGLIASVQEIEGIFEDMVLDIEFAVNSRGEVIIFQVRPLAASYKYAQDTDDISFFELKNVAKKAYMKLSNDVDADGMMLSDMAFWNPSEIVGSNPRNLDYSLYREIITKRAWNEGLVPMGYKKVAKDLMYKIGNKPYISLEYSFLSLIPDALDHKTSIKLMQYYRKKLKQDITAHDKIEFEIVLSCFDFTTENRLADLLEHGFSEMEIEKIKTALFSLTDKALLDYFDVLQRDKIDLEKMAQSRDAIEKELPFRGEDLCALLDYFKVLIGDVKNYGTPQFSRQARYAFIANSLCRSMVSRGYFSEDEIGSFMLSIRTVASEFEEDFAGYLSGSLSRHDFDRKYGHLRSGTYDIRAKRYDQISFQSSPGKGGAIQKEGKSSSELGLEPVRLKKVLQESGFKIAPELFLDVLRSAFEQREFFKFEFTKSLSLAIEVVAKIGEILDIERSLLSYLEMPDLLASGYYSSEEELKSFLLTIIGHRKAEHGENSKLILSDVISTSIDVDFIHISELRPNFITKKVAKGEIVFLEDEPDGDIGDKIVAITKADPGFDWIFAKGIKGLITKYGGVASHMAIRCAEFGIPAAIGCGEKIYSNVLSLSSAVLDCKNGKILRLED
nr:PEP/pyruvate-binding domain-containing protein [uncultured Dethiosulfovibrio sp.]